MNQHADAKIMIAWLENYEDHLYFPIGKCNFDLQAKFLILKLDANTLFSSGIFNDDLVICAYHGRNNLYHKYYFFLK